MLVSIHKYYVFFCTACSHVEIQVQLIKKKIQIKKVKKAPNFLTVDSCRLSTICVYIIEV